jgi:putative transposase
MKRDQAALRMRIRELAEARVRYGYYRIYILLRREGWKANHKRVYLLTNGFYVNNTHYG